MRPSASILAVFLLISAPGCLMEVLTTTAIQGELAAQNASAATRQLSKAKESTAETQLRQAISTYHAEKGTYPPTLEALVPNWLPAVPAQPNGQPYNYDPWTGQFWQGNERPARPVGITPGDRQKMDQIRKAVNAYGTAVGYYPPSLQALVQYGYLTQLPLTDAGEQFLFNPQNGALNHPAEYRQPQGVAQSGGGFGGAGAGPMGEAMTGVAIQNQLGNMGGGASQTGSRVREGARDSSGTYSDRQMQTLKDLDLE